MTFEDLKARAAAHGQGHVFAFWDELGEAERRVLLEQVAQVDFELVDKLRREFLEAGGQDAPAPRLEPAPLIRLPETPEELSAQDHARALGKEALRAGRIGAFLVAGGQGTRLGLDGPKGAFEIGPVTKRTLFQIHAEKIAALRALYGAAIPWVVMTSDANDHETRAHFEKQKYFGLPDASVWFCKQGNMPALSPDGKLLLSSKSSLALSPNGHGGSIKALEDAGILKRFRAQGIDTLFYFQVDNPLCRICDPVFLGRHLQTKAEMSSKAVAKAGWEEKVGVFGLIDGRPGVIEYSDLPEELAKATDASGSLRFNAGNIAIHVLDVGFVERLNAGGFRLPYHRASKAVPCIGLDGKPVALMPGEKNGVKFETFVFDALSLAKATLTMQTRREDDFAPVKNAEGVDSPATARALLVAQYARWLESAGHAVPRTSGGAPDCRIEISPRTSLDGQGLQEKSLPRLERGGDVVI